MGFANASCVDIDNVLAAIGRLRQPAENKNDEEQIIRAGPDKAGLSNYLSSMKRLGRSHNEMQASNLRANQTTFSELGRLIKIGNVQLEEHFEKIIRGETPRSIEPLHYITKDKPFPVLPQDATGRLGLIYNFVAGHQQGGQNSKVAKVYAEVRGPYLSSSLNNLAAASINTTKRKNPGAVYRAGTNGIGTYAQALEGIFLSEHENICSIFSRDDWGTVFQATCQGALTELARTLRELNSHVKGHMGVDCCLAYEILEIMASLSEKLEARIGELKSSLAAALKPVRETARASLAELMEDNRRKIAAVLLQEKDTAPPPVITEAMQRLQGMVAFLRPISSIMISLGDGGWKSSASAANRSNDGIPSLASFDIGADGQDLFAKYCVDTIDNLLTTLEGKSRAISKNKSVQGVLLGNSTILVEKMIRDSELKPLLESRLEILDKWKKKSTVLYSDPCVELSRYLFDTIHTNRTQRPTSGPPDSASVVKSLSSKDKDKIKHNFQSFNTGFDELITKHKTYTMDREVRKLFGDDIRKQLQPLYGRFWDRYHEIDKGKGKHVKYDKNSIDAIFSSLSS